MTDMWNNKWTMPRAISKMSMGGDLNGVSVETLIITHVSCWDDECSGASISLSRAVFLVIPRSFKVMNAFRSVVWRNWIMGDVHMLCSVKVTQRNQTMSARVYFLSHTARTADLICPGKQISQLKRQSWWCLIFVWQRVRWDDWKPTAKWSF